MLKGTDDGHAWQNATPDARKALCQELAGRTGRDEDFQLVALDNLYDSDDPNVLKSPIEGMAGIAVAGMHLRPQGHQQG